MVFSSIPAYFDPTNWQQPSNHQAGNSKAINQLLQPPPLSPAQPHAGGGPGAAAYIRPGSMAERARLANIHMPEAPQKCPRCESSNTKFCYFNNYSLTQPRHFCKACRRYWTRGGALRNVPVGGGCRRYKRTKATRSKSPVSSDRQTTSSSTTNTNVSSNSTGPANILGLLPPQIPPLRFLSPLSQLTADHYTAARDVSEMNFQVGPNNLLGCGILGDGVASLLSSGAGAGAGGIEQWRLLQQAQQFPFLGGLESSPSGLYSQFQASTIVEPPGFFGQTSHFQVRPKLSTSMLTQETSVKMDRKNHQEFNFSRQLTGIPGNIQWTSDLTSFSSSCTSNPS